MSEETRYTQLISKRGMEVDVGEDEVIRIVANEHGTIALESNLSPNYGGLGVFEITGLEPRAAAKKKKSFWKNLWNKIKKAAAAVLDAVTVPVFGYRCRPDIKVDIKGRGISIGISCTEA